ncbi:ABC transporter permease [Clostridium guangxiense]|uniref:ABC transporter permease n=1 Tax=Clostridium guangxiense TaxID=1662055 RepID=UPI001E5A1F1F|nr:ABC transporter permease [Clostridium guangxiense]MCD2346693.1 ABC transporter permease [Clostridium guangxiense]
MKGSIQLIITEFKLFFRNYVNLFFTIVFPGLMLVLFGEIYGNAPSKLFNGYGTIDISTPAYCAMIIAVTGIMSIPLSIVNYRETKVLKRYMVTPVRVSNILIAEFVVNLVMTIIGILILLIIGKVIYNIHIRGSILAFAIILLFCILVIFSIGLLIGSLASSTKNANAISNTVYFPMLFLSGATIPAELFPSKIDAVSKILPLTYVVKVLKGIWIGTAIDNYIKDLLILAVIFVICITISIKKFKWQ